MSVYEDEKKDKKLQKILTLISCFISATTAKMRDKIQAKIWKLNGGI